MAVTVRVAVGVTLGVAAGVREDVTVGVTVKVGVGAVTAAFCENSEVLPTPMTTATAFLVLIPASMS